MVESPGSQSVSPGSVPVMSVSQLAVSHPQSQLLVQYQSVSPVTWRMESEQSGQSTWSSVKSVESGGPGQSVLSQLQSCQSSRGVSGSQSVSQSVLGSQSSQSVSQGHPQSSQSVQSVSQSVQSVSQSCQSVSQFLVQSFQTPWGGPYPGPGHPPHILKFVDDMKLIAPCHDVMHNVDCPLGSSNSEPENHGN